jgi:hypothetical protein
VTTRYNDSPNPWLKYDATGCYGGSRLSTTSLPSPDGVSRNYCYNMPSGGAQCTLPEVAAVAGKKRAHAMWVRARDAAKTLTVELQTYNGGAFIATSASATFSLAKDTWTRVNVNLPAAPAGTTSVRTVLSTDGTSTFDASLMLFENQDSIDPWIAENGGVPPLDYFDGDTPGASWNGANGNSASTKAAATTTVQQAGADTFTLTESAALSQGPAGLDGAALADTGVVDAAVAGADAVAFRDGALVIALGYDEQRGRVRIDAHGFDPAVVRAVVLAKAANAHTFTEVRGGRRAVTGGQLARPVDDYEYAAGMATTYQVLGLTTPDGMPDVVGQQALVTRDDTLDVCWLKFIPAPYLNRRITLADWGDVERQARAGRFDVVGQAEPVVVLDVHSGRSVKVQLRTRDAAERDQLDHALGQGMPLFLHTPAGIALPSLYAAVGDYSWRRTARRSQQAVFDIALTEVAPPPPSVVSPPSTWRQILDTYPTWADLLAALPTWQRVVD